jgi:patatin-like phospholipase/acyl hydrolase
VPSSYSRRIQAEYLAVIEDLLRKRSGKDDFRLCDYFDLIGGTSTGAIIAPSLACGMSVAELKTLYREIGTTVFEPSFLRKGILVPKFPADRVQKARSMRSSARMSRSTAIASARG